MRNRHRLVALGIAVVASLATLGLGIGRLDGLSIDLLFWLREHLLAPSPHPADSPTVVVALDEETHRRPPFADVPNAAWTREIGEVLDAIVAAGPKVVGFDVIFPTSMERLKPGFDRDFLLALNRAAQQGKIVLGKVQHQAYLPPFRGQIIAVGREKNVRAANLFRDADEVIRRVPLTLESEDLEGGARIENSMALELASRALGAASEPRADGTIALGGRVIPGSARNAMLLNFEAGEAIPTYSLADLHACAGKGDAAFFRAHFADKVVLIGGVLDIEDRKVTSKRLITAPEGASTASRCVYPPMMEVFREDLIRDTIPGVYVHATGVNDLLRGSALGELDPRADGTIVLIAALAAAAAAMTLRPLGAGLAFAGGAALWTFGAVAAFRAGFVLPLLMPPIAAALTLALLMGYRFGVADRDKRLLRSGFSLYLPTAVVDRMLEADRLPALGGELREITAMHSDLEGFASLAERLAPAELVEVINEYLTAMTDIIEAEGGFVDKYVGDAIVAVFGAPLDDKQHALHAARAALACRAKLARMSEDQEIFRGQRLRARIGLSTGEALVGNIGSRRRFNYTVMGDTVNVAARLEGANKVYGTGILATDAVRLATEDRIVWREIDWVRVKGRDQPIAIWEPLGLVEEVAPETLGATRDFAVALSAYRAGKFASALETLEGLAKDDGPARALAVRARDWLADGATEPWDAITQLDK
jgi:adenylate cyclase